MPWGCHLDAIRQLYCHVAIKTECYRGYQGFMGMSTGSQHGVTVRCHSMSFGCHWSVIEVSQRWLQDMSGVVSPVCQRGIIDVSFGILLGVSVGCH